MQTEITVQVYDEIKNIISKLETLGFEKYNYLSGEDCYYTSIKTEEIKNSLYKDLMDSSVILRSFTMQGREEKTNLLLHKTKLLDEVGNVIGETKTQVKIDNQDNAKIIFDKINLKNWITLKQQNTFLKNGEITIIVGKVDGLEGYFIEIEEYDLIKEKTHEEKFEILSDYVRSLGLKTGTDFSCKKVYMLYIKNAGN